MATPFDEEADLGALEKYKRQSQLISMAQRLRQLEKRLDAQKGAHEIEAEVKKDLSGTLWRAAAILATLLVALCAGMFALFSNMVTKSEDMQARQIEVINGKFTNMNERIDMYHPKGKSK